MRIRSFLGSLLLVVCGGCFAATPSASPNIVFLIGDDWGYTDVGAFGSEIQTPNLDSLAKSGIKFSNFPAAATCSPTRSMLLTGVDNHRNGMGAMSDLMLEAHRGKPGYLGHLSDNAVTLATMLRGIGYHTYITGKWHLGDTPDTLPTKRGFDRSYIQVHGSSDNWEQRPWLPWESGQWVEDGKNVILPHDYYSSKLIVDKAIEYIESTGTDGKPFFAYVAFQAVHIPVQAPREFSDKYRGRYDAGWTALRNARRERAVQLGLIPNASGMVEMHTTADWSALNDTERADQARRMEVYAGMAEAMDFHVGRLINHLKQTGQYENTIFIFLSDNGAEALDPHEIAPFRWWLKAKYDETTDHLGDKGAYAFIGPSWASASVSPLSTYKQWAGEGALRTPMIIAGLPGTKSGQLNSSFVHVTDIVPTVLELTGITPHNGHYAGKPVEPLRGKSLLTMLQGRSDRAHQPDEPIGYELQGNAALFKGDYKIVKNLHPIGDGQWHLYNIAKDPGEVSDLRAELPAVFQSMLSDYTSYKQNNNVLPVPDDYDYPKQGFHYAVFHYLLPRLVSLWPYFLAMVIGVFGILYWRRRRAKP